MFSSWIGAQAATFQSASLNEAIATTLSQKAKLVPPATARTFGFVVSLSGNRALVGAGMGSDGTTGSAFVFVQNGTTWSLEAELKSSDEVVNDSFGSAVSLSGNRALVGATFSGTAGAAYVFVFDGTTWTQEAKLTPADGVSAENFGGSVSLAGGRALIGAPLDNGWVGSAYVFTLRNRGWRQTAKLTSSTGVANDFFGSVVALSGKRALIGAFGDASDTGAAYVFLLTGNTWSLEAKLQAADGRPGDFFSNSISISGNRALVGAPFDDNGAFGNGSAYVFVRNGSTWTQEAELTAADKANNDSFGYSVSISGDSALIGAPDHARSFGSVYLFGFDGTNWTQQQELHTSDTIEGDMFGFSLSLSGTQALIGARDADVNRNPTGAAYIFGP